MSVFADRMDSSLLLRWLPVLRTTNPEEPVLSTWNSAMPLLHFEY